MAAANVQLQSALLSQPCGLRRRFALPYSIHHAGRRYAAASSYHACLCLTYAGATVATIGRTLRACRSPHLTPRCHDGRGCAWELASRCSQALRLAPPPSRVVSLVRNWPARVAQAAGAAAQEPRAARHPSEAAVPSEAPPPTQSCPAPSRSCRGARA
eukprot:1961826-Prymnesium_polylepis.1